MEGGELTDTDSPDGQTSSSTNTDDGEYWLDKLCVYYMGCGVTPEQFWHGDYTLLKYYEKAEQARQRRENYYAWLNGAYTLYALQATVGNLFRKSGSKPNEYPREPIPLTKKEQEAARAREAKEREERFIAQAKADAELAEAMRMVAEMNKQDKGSESNDG